MKQVIIIVVALGLIILFNFWQTTYLENTSKYLLADIQYVINHNEREDFEKVEEGINALEETWKMVEPSWDMLGDHAHMKEINESIISMKINSNFKDKQSLAQECSILKFRIKTIVENEKLKLSNIF